MAKPKLTGIVPPKVGPIINPNPTPPPNPWEPDKPLDDMIAELEEGIGKDNRYSDEPCPFVAGEYVTAREGTSAHGRPFKIVQVFDEPQYLSMEAGKLLNPVTMITAVMLDGVEHRFPEHHSNYQKFDQ